MTTIAIIGAGFSGTVLTWHLLRRCPASTKLLLIERNGRFGPGVAYSTGNPNHVLNVPAARMSAFQDQPDDFLHWLIRQPDAASLGPNSFAPRQMFGAYIQGLLSDEAKPAGRDRLTLVKGNVSSLECGQTRMAMTIDQDRVIQADIVVLAPGSFPPASLPVANPGFYETSFYRPNPWAEDALAELDTAAPVLLLGTGLTMIDMTISLLDQGHRGPIYALSRRGLLPRRHATGANPAPGDAPLPTSVIALTRFLRSEAGRVAASGGKWQSVIDAVRPFTVDVWQAMTLRDRGRFLRHVRPWWDVHRHRMANAVADRIEAARAAGQLRVIAGSVRDYGVRDARVEVTYRPRGQDRPHHIEAARVINCIGLGADYDRVSDPLIRQLLRDGAVRPDPLRLGLDVAANCAVLHRDGAASPRLFAVGPVTRGVFWEMTAVPDIRRQSEKLAEHLAGLVNATSPKQPEVASLMAT